MGAKAILLGAALTFAVFTGCSLLNHQPTPEQQYAKALARGYGAEASRLWLSMTPEQRMNFQRGAGLEAADREQAAKSASKRLAQDAQEGADPSVSIPQIPTGGSLEDLGSYSDSLQ
jgi:hypothetical protein